MSSDENITYIIGSEHFITDQRLIKEVENNPLLWDKNHKDYNNRSLKEIVWERIGTGVLKKNKIFAKQRWKILRDQFTKEMKKVKVPYGNPTKPNIDYYRGKWVHFEPMIFLLDMLLGGRKTKIRYSPDKDIDIHEDDMIKKEGIVFEDDLSADQAINNNSSDNYEKEPAIISTPQIHRPIKTEILDVEECVDNGLKRPAEYNNVPPVPAKTKRPAVADASSNTDNKGETHEENGEIDDDLHFVKSLVPYLRKLTPIRKLLVRNEIQSLLIRESLCENCKFGNSSSHPS